MTRTTTYAPTERLGPYTLIQPGGIQRLTADSLLLADFVLPLSRTDTVVDLGTGSGVIPILLCWKSEVGRITAVDIEDECVDAALKNVMSNDLSKRVEVVKRDWRELKEIYPRGSFSVVLSNPPYTKRGTGRVSPDTGRAAARYETHGTLRELLEVSRHLAGDDGRISFVYPVRRLAEFVKELERIGLRPVRLRFVHTSRAGTAKLFLVEARSKGGLSVEPPVFL